MWGFILKDLLVLRKQATSLGVILVIYIVSLGFLGSTAFAALFCVLLSGSLMASTVTYDHQARWDTYALALPVTRRQIVAAKYGLLLLLSLAGMAASLLCVLIRSLATHTVLLWELVGLPVLGLAGTILVNSVLLPLLLWFGPERGRLFYILLFALFGGLLGVTASFSQQPEGPVLHLLPLFLLPVAAGVLLLSYHISAAIYAKKEG